MEVAFFALVGLAPWFIVALVVGIRAPMLLLALYAAILPFGSGITVPVGVPPPFNTATTLLGIATMLGILCHLAVARTRAQELSAAVPLWVFFLGLTAATTIWSVNPPETLRRVVILVSLVGLYAVAAFLRVRWQDLRVLEHGIVWSGALTGIYALFLLFTGAMHLTGAGEPRFMTAGGGGEGGDPNITAASLLLPLVVALGRGLQAQRQRRITYLTSAALTATAIMLTGSRGGLLAVICAVVVLAWNDRRTVATVTYILVPLLAIGLAFTLADTSTQARVQQEGGSGREEIWRLGLVACKDHCPVGSGWGTFSDVYYETLLNNAETSHTRFRVEPHSIWLRVVVEMGVMGFLVLMAALATTWRNLAAVPRSLRGPPLAALTGLIVTQTFLSDLDFKYFWLVLMYGLLTWSAQREEAPEPAQAELAGSRYVHA